MNKIVVGVLPQSIFKTDDNPYNDKYVFVDLYTKRIIEAGGIPFGLIASNNIIPNELLDMCDAFLIQGGINFKSYHFQVIDYAIKNNKPLLGICLGMQALSIYSVIIDNIGELNLDLFWNEYNRLREENNDKLLEKMTDENIHLHLINYENSDEARHIINIVDKDSILYDIYKKDTINEVSLHSYKVMNLGSKFKSVMVAEDNVIEGIEYIDKSRFIVGVQYHPEWDNDNLLFNRLIEEGIKRKNE